MIRINRERLEKQLEQLAEYGKNEGGGIDRSIGSLADLQARNSLKRIWSEMGLTIYTDGIANLWASSEGGVAGLRPIVSGSHHDVVPDGGKYDGILGVLLATEVQAAILDSGYRMRHPYRIVSFTAEEPNPFNISTMGSRSITGKLSRETLLNAADDKGRMLEDAISEAGGNIASLPQQILKPGDFSAFLECHIEQGRNLFDAGLSVAVVSKITGIYREKIVVYGEANHSGTTLMENRHDAQLGAAELSLLIEDIVKRVHRNDVVATVGKMDILPNAANIICGETRLIMELRTPETGIKEAVLEEFSQGLLKIEEKRGISFQREIILDQPEVSMDQDICNALKKGCKAVQDQEISLVSMAGHDSVHMARIGPTGMLFVQSVDGISHSRRELTYMDDIEKAANALLQAVLLLDERE